MRFICRTECFWANQLWKEGMAMDYPANHANLVPHHFECLDKPVDGARPEPVKVAASVGDDGYDPREIAAVAGLHHKQRAKLLSTLGVEVPGNADPRSTATLILDAAKLQGIDPLPADVRKKIDAEPVTPRAVSQDDLGRAPDRKSAVAIGDTL